MEGFFYNAISFNQDISSWNVSNVFDISKMFYNAEKFDKNISNWNLDNIKDSYFMFKNTNAFIDKYNNGEPLPEDTEAIIQWINKNKEKMNNIHIKDQYGDEIDKFFSIINNNEIKKDK